MGKFKIFLKTWKEELLGIPAAIFVFMISAPFLRWIDPTAGVYDIGTLQIIILSLVKAMFFATFAWIAVLLVFPSVWKFFQQEFDSFYNKLEPWQKLRTGLFIFFGFLFVLVFVSLS